MATPLLPPPLALLTAQQELKKMCIYLYNIMPYSRISQDKQVFSLANKI